MKEHILKEASIPLYLQIKHNIANLIRSGQIRLGGQLPSEPKLAKQFGVAHLTVRQALDELAKENLIERKRGVGTFVTTRTDMVSAHLAFPPSLTSLFAAQGYKSSSSTITKTVTTDIPDWGAELLRLKPDEPVAHLQRLRLANDKPMAINHSWLPNILVPELTEIELVGDSLVQTLVELYKLLPSKGVEWVEPAIATTQQASLLKIPEGTPLLLMTTISRLADDTPVEFSKSWWRGDSLRLQINSRDFVMIIRDDLSWPKEM